MKPGKIWSRYTTTYKCHWGVVLRVTLRGQDGVGSPILRLSINPEETLLW